MAKSIGIKELKDQASAIIDDVEAHRRPVSITRHRKEVARIVPVPRGEENLFEELQEAGRIASLPRLSWEDLKLKKIHGHANAQTAIRSITKDRDER